MAAALADPHPEPDPHPTEPPPPPLDQLYTTYLGLSFAIFLSLFPTLHSHTHYLRRRLRSSEDELLQLRSRRQEDSKANARVVEIFATHRNAWQKEERRLLRRLDDSCEEISRLRATVSDLEAREANLLLQAEDLRREVGERDEMINFMSKHKTTPFDCDHEVEVEVGDTNFMGSSGGSKFWPNDDDHQHNNNPWQNVQYETIEPMHHVKHYVVRRESPWKVDGESTGVPSKLKLLEEELLNLEKVGKSNSSKVSSSLRKQAKRYQDLAGKIDDLCGRMQASDPSEAALSPEFRSQRQTEFLLEAFQLQQRSSETGKKLMVLQTEVYTSSIGDDLGLEGKYAMRRSLDSIKSNFKEIQRNLEIWLARIMGDLEGILARDGASRVRDYYYPRYPCVNNFS